MPPQTAKALQALTTRRKPGRKTGEQTEATILEVATEAFTKYGYDRVSTRMIAEQAGITVPSIYLHFKDKRALYLKCCLTVFKRGTETIGRQFSEPGTLDAKLYRFTLALATVLIEEPYLLKLFQRELLEADEEGLAILERETFYESYGALKQTIAAAVAKPPPLAALSIYALMFGLVQYKEVGHFVRDDMHILGREPEHLAKSVLQIVLPEVYKRLFEGQ
jgi:AcrR family transcriptional regulator